MLVCHAPYIYVVIQISKRMLSILQFLETFLWDSIFNTLSLDFNFSIVKRSLQISMLDEFFAIHNRGVSITVLVLVPVFVGLARTEVECLFNCLFITLLRCWLGKIARRGQWHYIPLPIAYMDVSLISTVFGLIVLVGTSMSTS